MPPFSDDGRQLYVGAVSGGVHNFSSPLLSPLLFVKILPVEIRDSFNITRPDFGTNPAVFIKEVIAELKKVRWPTRQETIRLTAVVIGVSIIVGIYLGGLDYVFAKGVGILLSK